MTKLDVIRHSGQDLGNNEQAAVHVPLYTLVRHRDLEQLTRTGAFRKGFHKVTTDPFFGGKTKSSINQLNG